jgi:hypothetical protein
MFIWVEGSEDIYESVDIVNRFLLPLLLNRRVNEGLRQLKMNLLSVSNAPEKE